MPLQPFIFVGVGGTGGKTLGVVRKTLDDALGRLGWTEGWPAGWQFVHIDVPADTDTDTDTAANPYSLPRTNYLPLTTRKSTYVGYHEEITKGLAAGTASPAERYVAWDSWRPEPASGVPVVLPNGAGQYRALGRVAVLRSLKSVEAGLRTAFESATTGEASMQLRRIEEMRGREVKPGDVKPNIFVIGSLSGGSGSGMFLDVTDVLRAQGHVETVGILFTPDVFADAKGTIDPGIAPNTFLALSEIANAMWTHREDDAPVSRNRLFDRAGVSYPVGRGGPAAVFLVGRKNGSLSFDSADDIFKIVGRSLGELTLDGDLTTEVVGYDMTNVASTQDLTPDALGLSSPSGDDDLGSFRAMGFARLSVGRDFFDRYATDRLLRRVSLRLLDGHLERRQPGDVSSDDELLADLVDEVWPAFLLYSHLDEVNIDAVANDEVLNRLDAWSEKEVTAKITEFRTKVRDAITKSAEKGNINNVTARTEVVRTVEAARADKTVANALDVATRRLAIKLQENLQTDIVSLVLRSVASNGLPVTVALMDRLIARSTAGVSSLGREKTDYAKTAKDRVRALLTPPPAAPAQFPAGSTEDIQTIVNEATAVLRLHVRGHAAGVSNELLADIVVNLLEPWRRSVSDADGLLRLVLRPSQGTSPLTIWPEDLGVPEYLRPSKVEYLLDPIEGFPEQFVRVVERSVAGPKGLAAVVTATEQIIAGLELGVNSKAKPVAKYAQPWIPRTEAARPLGQTPAAAQLELAFSVDDLKQRVHDWITDQEKFSGQFLTESLADYLTDKLTPAPQLQERQSTLVGSFDSMLKAGKPLVALQPQMTSAVHGQDTPEFNLHTTALNVPGRLPDLRRKLEDVATALLGTKQAVRFTDDPAQDAMMFVLLKIPYHMLEVASVMEPVTQLWAGGGIDKKFWKYRRARPLSEWVPLGPHARRALVAGWLAARLLGNADAEGGAHGLILTLKANKKTYSIPTTGARADHKDEQIGILLESLVGAMVEAFSKKSLTPLEPFQHLIELGGSLERKDNEVTDWIRGKGTAAGFARMADDLAKGKSRQDAASSVVEAWKTAYAADLERIDDVRRAQSHPTYEVHEDVMEALHLLADAVTRQEEESVK